MPAMTTYVSRYAATGELTADRIAPIPASMRPCSADPPLLTHVWRIVFERQARDSERR
ncbi:multiple cyclophane-containing RiPP AmcA [Salinispora oceanensis]|uniref:multiple cyclophane-containing RiPP AmcA n=1 Tax=Salinispora oceanensis TaxID=1050199 RepID=UPI00295BBAAA|nr:multiple cyclophane-containing RiPP AmcA [Salinispora oceanensis]